MPIDSRKGSLTRELGKISRRKRKSLSYFAGPGGVSASVLTPGGEIPPIFEVTGCFNITVPASSIDATLTGFVVPYDLSDAPADFWSGVKDSGSDVYVTDAGTRIPAHVVAFDKVANTGFLLFRAPSLSSSVDNEFLCCWGDDTTVFAEIPEIDWTSNVTNPDAESGDLTGWTSDTGTMLASTSAPHSGTYKFLADTLNVRYFQDVDVPAADESKVDSGEWVVKLKWWQDGESNDYGMMGFTFLDSGSSQLDEEWKSSARGFSDWGQREFSLIPPSSTRKIRIWMESRGNSGGVHAYFDDIELSLKNVDVNKQWGVWQDYIAAGFIEDANAVNYGPGEPTMNIEAFGGGSPVYSALTMGAGGGVTPGATGTWRGFFGAPLNTDQFSQGITMIPSDVSTRQVALGFTKTTSASEPADESQWVYHDALGELRTTDDVNGVLASGDTLVNTTAYRVGVIYDATSARRIYLDGSETAEDLVITVATNDFGTIIVAQEDQSGAEQWEGGVGYAWMRRDVVSEEWFAAEHLALSDPATFFNAAVFQGNSGTYLRYDGSAWGDVPVTTIRDDIQDIAAPTWDADTSVGTGAHFLLPQDNDAVTPTLAFGDGDTGFYEVADDTIGIATLGLVRFKIGANIFDGEIAGGPRILNETASSTNPTFVPSKSDNDTGLGWAADDQLSLVAGGVEALRLVETGTVTTDQLILFPAGAHIGSANATPTLAFGDGDTGFYEQVDDQIRLSHGGTASWVWVAGKFNGLVSRSPALMNETASGTNPTLVPDNADTDTGIGSVAVDQLSLIAGAKEMLRLVETGTGTTDQIIIAPAGIIGAAATPALAFGDGDTGFYESADDDLRVATAGSHRFTFGVQTFYAASTGASGMRNQNPSGTVPNIHPANNDTDTGLGHVTADAPCMVAGGIQGTTWTEISSSIILSDQSDVGLTAHIGSSQGDGPILSTYNVYSTVATTGDAATLPATFRTGTQVFVKNDGANSMDIFPTLGDDAGAGVDTVVALAAGVGTLFVATVADSTWTQMF